MLYKKIYRFLAKFKKIKYTLLISYILSFIILAVFSSIKFKLSLIEKDKEYYRILHTTRQIHLEVIENELMKILNVLEIVHDKPNNVDFFKRNLLLNFLRISNITEHTEKPFKIDNSFNSTEITAGFYSVRVDTQLLKRFISKNIPQNINFKIDINNQVIVGNGNKGDIFIKNTVTSPFSSVITLILSIKEDYISEDRNKIIRAQILEFIIIITPIIIINIIFGKIYLFSITRRFKTMKLSYVNLREEQSLLSRHMKTKNKYNELLITKIKQKVKNKALEVEDSLDDLLYFPLLIEEDQCSSIESAIFFEDLTSFFQYSINKKKIDFRYSVTCNVFTVYLSKENFYQLTFSLFHNVLHLLNNKSFLFIKFEIKNNLLSKIIIKYTGFQLSKEQMKSYTEEQGKGEIFLLNMHNTLKGLEKLCVNCETKSSDDQNIIQLNFQVITQSSKVRKNDDNNIINLRDYRNK